MEMQQHLVNYTGTLTGKEHLKSGHLRKCTKKGALKQRYFLLVKISFFFLHCNDYAMIIVPL